ncbi:hypothetical protein [Helicobacter sp. 11S02629-2]|uniref:hypothetical protein n=1 Tax=Helicobacter sp. 11S02629-2 TaxID=1476195 RepID=UPI000BA6D02D|nr:hypothetical protein [Helicobacter sp. 11S02629-2]PAF45525.1 hypothetical protein BKH40_03430 [Helicobacter sp. 11S02629-2]
MTNNIAQEPQKIYSRLQDEIDRIIDSIKPKGDDELAKLGKGILDEISAFKELKLDKEVALLEKNANWDTFTLAFYGETNAGKSTLIEALRIYFKEATKVQSEQKFKEAQKQKLEVEAKSASLHEEIKKLSDAKSEHVNNLSEIDSKVQALDKDIKDIQDALEGLNTNLVLLTKTKDELNSKIKSTKDKKDSLEKEMQEATKKLDETTLKKTDFEARLQLISRRLEELKNASALVRFFKLFSKLKLSLKKLTLESSLVSLEKLLNKITLKIKLDKSALEAMFTDCENQTKTLKELTDKQDSYETELSNTSSKLKELQEKLSKYDGIRDEETAKLKEYEVRIKEIESNLKESEEKIESFLTVMKEHRDGLIIGDGRSDFTREVSKYEFAYQDKRFAILDVPGIEGNEILVQDAINNAVAQAHAVFYITREPRPPQKGDGKSMGTIEKIKRQLGAQSEVYALYNKPVTSLHALPEHGLINKDEEEGLKDLDSKLGAESELGSKHYRGHKALSARLPFLALGKCFIEGKKDGKDQKKFLSALDSKELLAKSQFLDFASFLTNDLVVNTKEKILLSHLNKAKEVLTSFEKIIECSLKEKVEKYIDINKNSIQTTIRNINTSSNTTEQSIRSDIESKIDEIMQITRKGMYDYIDNNGGKALDNDKFKLELEMRLERVPNLMEGSIGKIIKINIEKLKEKTKKYLEDLGRRLDNTEKAIVSFSVSMDKGIHIEVETPSSFSISSLFSAGGGLVGIGAGIWGAIAIATATGPIGWLILGMAGAVAGIVAGAMGLFSAAMEFFSDSKKKSNQKKKTDKAIHDFHGAIKKSLDSLYKEVSEKLDEGTKAIIDELEGLIKDMDDMKTKLLEAKNNLKLIANEI